MCRATCALFVVLAFVLAVPTAAQESSPSGAKDDNDASLLERSQRHIDGLVTLPLDRELFGISGSGTLARQPDDNVDETALAQQAQNPVADLVSLPIQHNALFNIGEHDRTRSVTNIQPVIPVKLGRVNLISRAVVPLVYGPNAVEPSGGTFGVGDTTYTAFFSPAGPSSFIWGAGPVALFPTASDEQLGTEKWGLGPSAVGLTIQGGSSARSSIKSGQ